MTNLEKLRETFPETIFIFRKNGNDETVAIMCSDEWLQGDYDQMYKDSAPCEDCVSRRAMLDGLASIAKAKAKSDAQKSLMGRVIFFTEQLPPVTPKPRTGKWIPTQHFDEWYCPTGECSNCGIEHIYGLPFCPACGAKMEAENEDKK